MSRHDAFDLEIEGAAMRAQEPEKKPWRRPYVIVATGGETESGLALGPEAIVLLSS